MENKSTEIIESSINFFLATGCYPTRKDLADMGFSRDSVRNAVGSYENIKDIIAKENPDIVFDLKRSRYRTSIKSKKTYIIVNAVCNAQVNDEFLSILKNMAKSMDAEIVVTVSVASGGHDMLLDPKLREFPIVISNVNLNQSISIYGFKSKAKSTDPLMGLKRIGQRSGTFIVGSPKQNLRYVATQKDKLPNAIMSTGCVTNPNYGVGDLFSLRDYIADNDHVVGGIIVEIKNDKIYHFRQIQYMGDGVVNDLDKAYTATRVKKSEVDALVLGDWHTGYTDPVVKSVTFDMIKHLSPTNIMLHDFFDGFSVNHHEKGKQILIAKKADAGMLSLEGEIRLNVLELKEFAKTKKTIRLVDSNHHDFLSKYLEESKYVKHPYNHALCLKLAQAKHSGENPLAYALRSFGLKEKNIVFMDRDDSFSVSGIELGAHGDRGPNGSRASVTGLEDAYLDCVVGHAHTPGITRGVFVVGTSTERHAHYGPGHPGSWMNTHCAVFSNGQRQLINIIEGEYTLGA